VISACFRGAGRRADGWPGRREPRGRNVRGRFLDGRRQQLLPATAAAAATTGRVQQRRRRRQRRWWQFVPGAAARGQRQGKEKNAEVGTYPRPQGYRKDVRFTAGVTQNPQTGVYFSKIFTSSFAFQGRFYLHT
jgi:hypothetical protein